MVYIVPWFLLLALPLPTQYMWFVSCIWYLMQCRFDKVNFVLRYQRSRTASNCHWRTYDGSRKSSPWGRSFGVCSWVQSPSECCAVCADIMLNVTTIYPEFIIYGANTNFLCSEYYLLSSVTHLMRHVRKHWNSITRYIAPCTIPWFVVSAILIPSYFIIYSSRDDFRDYRYWACQFNRDGRSAALYLMIYI